MSRSLRAILYILIVAVNANMAIAQVQKSAPDRISDQIIVRMEKGQNPFGLGRLVSPNFELQVIKILSQYSDI